MLLILIFTGHLLGDFYFQSTNLATNKDSSHIYLIKHGIIYLASMFIVIIPILGLNYIGWVILLAILHFFIDGLKFYFNKHCRKFSKGFTYALDQLLHVISILLVSLLIYKFANPIQYTLAVAKIDNFFTAFNFSVSKVLKWGFAIIFIAKPTSISIDKTLEKYKPITIKPQDKGHTGAGALIGMLERLIILLMLSQNQYSAIGFVLTAKSIARYNKIVEDPQFAEYYLLGTLLSFIFVLVIHLLVFS